jgi:hypothetical protein
MNCEVRFAFLPRHHSTWLSARITTESNGKSPNQWSRPAMKTHTRNVVALALRAGSGQIVISEVHRMAAAGAVRRGLV